MDDVFDDTVDENVLIQRESQKEREKFHNMGMKEGILEKKFDQDEDVVAEYFIEGFNKSIEVKRLLGRLAMIEYIANKHLPQDNEGTAQIIKTLNELLDRLGKDDNEKMEQEIGNLINEVKKFHLEP